MKTYRKLREWLYDKWITFYCRFHFFHLMRNEWTGAYVIVFDWNTKLDEIDDYYIVSSSWTPWGCKRSIESEQFFEALMKEPGVREAFLSSSGSAER